MSYFPLVQAEAARSEVAASRNRVEAERSALDSRAALLAPQFRALEEGRSLLEDARREGWNLFSVFPEERGIQGVIHTKRDTYVHVLTAGDKYNMSTSKILYR